MSEVVYFRKKKKNKLKLGDYQFRIIDWISSTFSRSNTIYIIPGFVLNVGVRILKSLI